jgi:hypothetical protein
MPILAMFEVMDKEPSLVALAVQYCVLCAIAFLVSLKRWWFGLLLLPVLAVFNNLTEIRDPYVGPAILHEGGQRYVALSYAMVFGALTFMVIAAFRQRSVQRPR